MDKIHDDIEYGLKLFYKLKYIKGEYDYSEIPKIVDSASKIESWFKQLIKGNQ